MLIKSDYHYLNMKERNYPIYISEFIATFALVLIGAGSVLSHNTGWHIGPVGIALAHGLVLMSMIYAIGHISGGHINPAVSIAMWVSDKISFVKCLFYVISQLLGGILAGLLLKIMFSSASSSLFLGVPSLGRGVGALTGIVVELILTFFLVFVVFGVSDERAPKGISGLAIGLVLTFGILVGGGLTGAAMNPARALGPAFASGFFLNHYVYWVGPVLGGVLAALVYSKLIKK